MIEQVTFSGCEQGFINIFTPGCISREETREALSMLSRLLLLCPSANQHPDIPSRAATATAQTPRLPMKPKQNSGCTKKNKKERVVKLGHQLEKQTHLWKPKNVFFLPQTLFCIRYYWKRLFIDVSLRSSKEDRRKSRNITQIFRKVYHNKKAAGNHRQEKNLYIICASFLKMSELYL